MSTILTPYNIDSTIDFKIFQVSAHLPLQVGVALRRQTGDLTRQYLQVRDLITIAWLILPWSVLVLIYFESLVEKKYKAFYVRVYRLPSGTHIHIYIDCGFYKAIKYKATHPDAGRARSFQKSSLSCNIFFASDAFSVSSNISFTFHRYQLVQGPLGAG